jgi:hypothetical protein
MPHHEHRRTQIALDKAAVARWDDEGGGRSGASAPVGPKAKGRPGQPANATHSTAPGAQILSNSCREPE